MKFGWLSSALLTAVLSCALVSCDKDDDDKKPETNLGPGKGDGGNITYRIIPVHDGVYIDSCKVYVKYGTETEPEKINQYDDSLICVKENGKPVATFYELRKGTYLFYAAGWDLVRSQNVEGTRVVYANEERTTTTVDLQVFAQ